MKLHKIGLTHGDVNGIGYEMLLRMLQDPELLEIFTPVIFGSAQVAQATATHLGFETITFNVIAKPQDAIDGRVNLINVCSDAEPELLFGQQTEAALQAEANSLTAALEAYAHHHIDAIVTLPGHLDNDATSHSLSDFIHRALGSESEAFDWQINHELRLLSLHQQDVSTQLGEGLASEAFQTDIKAISQSLRQDFGLMRPRLAVISQQSKLSADIDDLQEQSIVVFGPFGPRTFSEGQWQHHYDGCLFLGEDETMAQVLAAEESEYTIGYVSGLPLVLTYPMTGICYESAGKGTSSEVPLREAIYAAIDILRHRINYRHITHNPLEKQWIPRGRDDFKLDLTKED